MSSLGEFSRQPLMLRLAFHVISLFCLHRALYKIHTWKLFVYGKIFVHGKINSGRKSLGEKKEKRRPKEERKSTTLSSKEQNSFVKAISTNNNQIINSNVQIINYLSHRKIFLGLMKKFTTTTLVQTKNYTSLVSKQTSGN